MSEDVLIGWVHPGKVHAAFTDSLLRSIAYDRANGERFAGWLGVQCSANVSTGRNALVQWFLNSPAQWLIQIDTDMVWRDDSIHRLLAAADPDTAPIVGGLCFGLEADTGKIWPTMYDLAGTVEEPEFVRYDSWAPDAMFPVAATGAAFLLVHRSAFEKVQTVGSTTYPWFRESELAGKRVGEDVTFCLRAQQCGLPVFVHTGVHIGHIKEHLVTTEGYIAQRIQEENSNVERQGEVEGQRLRGGFPGPTPGGRDVPGAEGPGEQQGVLRGDRSGPEGRGDRGTEGAAGRPAGDPESNQGHEGDQPGRLAVVIPTRSRPAQVRSLLDAIFLTTTTDPLVILAADSDDPELAAYKLIAEQRTNTLLAIVADLPSGHVKAINVGAAAALHNGCFAVAKLDDDHMPLTHGWDAAYLTSLRELGTGVVYANDLLQGEKLPTAVALTTDIVRELGYMGPPSLRHLFVDNFWRDLGEAAGCLRYLPSVVVEHRHPLAGKAPMDDGYRSVNAPAQYANDGAAYNDFVATELADAVAKVVALRAAT